MRKSFYLFFRFFLVALIVVFLLTLVPLYSSPLSSHLGLSFKTLLSSQLREEDTLDNTQGGELDSAEDEEIDLLSLSPEEIIDRITTTVYGLKGYTAKVRITATIHSLGGISLSVNGQLYVRNPDLVSLKLTDVPEEVAKKYQTSFSKTIVPGIASQAYKEKYHIKFIGVRNYKGFQCFLLYLKPKKEGNVTRVLMWVDTKSYIIPKVIIYYRDGGRIVILQDYVELKGKNKSYKLIKSQVAEMFFPKVRATLESHFYDYHIYEISRSDENEPDQG